ncbi:DeoR/GlpR family DNA-binding transcription regulator [Streptococcus panodentis]|uniref:DeoR/GlpR transcriptional regulator n=1 Tax=Streptococcus panodentis TaxID=1581472 RepID=A0ABS5AVI0_9STRE|nr:DeoR/GlpR family DNA-binding transcription regulator [Streptococcus panodentis]MBP2620291.1 DeoR/GlpR transcriptional regulator [Streptococcus panodentis]
MYQEQRLSKMLELLQDKKQLAAKDMMDYFQVSKDTIRRDFSILSDRRLVRRTHGGIIPLEKSQQIPSFNDRISQLTQEKKAIAAKARDFLKPGQVSFFDVSTVVLHLAQRIELPMTIYSHSLDNAIMLSSQEQVDFHLLGGKFYPKNRFYYALNEAELLEQISFDTAFIGAASIRDGLVSFEDPEDAHLKKLALKHAKTKILLAEQAKQHKDSSYILGTISDFDYWITDQQPSPEVEELLAGQVTIIY